MNDTGSDAPQLSTRPFADITMGIISMVGISRLSVNLFAMVISTRNALDYDRSNITMSGLFRQEKPVGDNGSALVD